MKQIIDYAKTKQNFIDICQTNNYSAQDIQKAVGYSSPQAVYRILNPNDKRFMSIDALVAFAGYTGIPITDILILKTVE